MMSIREYVNCTDMDLREDFEFHIFENVWDEIVSKLPTEPTRYGKKHPYWFDGEEILCETSELAELMADILENVSGEKQIVHTGYYNPEEDALELYGPFKTTGWYYVDFD